MCFSVVPEEHWMGAQHDVKGPDASFFVEPSGKNSFDLVCRNYVVPLIPRVYEQQKQNLCPRLPFQERKSNIGVKWDLAKSISGSQINLE